MAAEKMNVYIVTKDKVQVAKKEGKWFKDLFLPLFKSNKDPLGKQPKLDDYWKEIRDCLVGKKKNKNLKVIKHKDLKFIAFNVKHGTILAFATGNEKSDSLNDIYKIAQEKSEGMTYEKFLKLAKATDSPAVLDKYNNLVQEGITDKQAKEWGYKNIEDLVKNGCNSEDSDIDHPYMNASPMGTIIDISNWDIKKWANEMIEKIKPLTKDEDITGVYEDATEMKISSTNDRYFGEWLITTYLEFYVRDANDGQEDDASFGDIVEYYGNKEVIDNQHKIEEEIAAYFIKDSLMFKSNKKSLQKSSDSKLSKKKVLYSDILDWLSEHDQAWIDYCEHFGLSEDGERHYITPDDTVGWISEHDLLYSDFLNRYNLDSDYVENINAEDYIKDDMKEKDKIVIIAPSGSGKGVSLLDTDEDEPVMALEENKSESLAEVEHDFITGLINYQDAVDTILDMEEANSESDAQAIVDAWELKNKKDTGKAEKVKFKIYLDEVKEPEEELKKLEHHFDYLYGDTNPGDYWDVKVDYHTDRYTVISGYISGVSREDFEAYIREGMDDYNALLKDIDWLEPLTGKELEKCIKNTMDEYEEVGQPFEQEEQFELINEEYLVDKKEFDKYWNKIVH